MKQFEGFTNLKVYFKKNIEVKLISNKVISGFFDLYTKAGDNDPEIESITLEKDGKYIDINTPDIIGIKILD